MGLRTKAFTLIAGVAGLAVFSQAPEFAQQYYQRLAGAVEELRIVVNDFDKEAQGQAMSREQALASLTGSKDGFAIARSKSMNKTISRFNSLDLQFQGMTNATPLLRPVEILKYPDSTILKGVWSIFKPAAPLSSSGLIYGGVGALVAIILARVGIGFLGRGKRRRQKQLQTARHELVVNDPVYHDEKLAIELGLLEKAAFKNYRKNRYGQSVQYRQEPPLLEPIAFEQKVHGEVDAYGKIVN